MCSVTVKYYYFFFFNYLLPHFHTATFIINTFMDCLYVHHLHFHDFLNFSVLFVSLLERFLRLSFTTMIQVSKVSILFCHNGNVDFICATVFLLVSCYCFYQLFPYPFCIFSSQCSVNRPCFFHLLGLASSLFRTKSWHNTDVQFKAKMPESGRPWNSVRLMCESFILFFVSWSLTLYRWWNISKHT